MMRRSMPGMILVLGCAAVGALGACGQKTYVGACPLALVDPPPLIAPAPGATGVAVTIGDIIVGSPVDGRFTLQAAGSAATTIGPAAALPSPEPSGVPTYNPASSFHVVPVPTLSPGVTYTVAYVASVGSPPCGSDESSGTLGSFTTK